MGESLLDTMLASVVRGDGGDRATVTPNVYYTHTHAGKQQAQHVCRIKNLIWLTALPRWQLRSTDRIPIRKFVIRQASERRQPARPPAL